MFYDHLRSPCSVYTHDLHLKDQRPWSRVQRSVCSAVIPKCSAVLQKKRKEKSATRPPVSGRFAGLHENQGSDGGPRASGPAGQPATWTRLMSLSRHTDLCCNTHGRHHKLSHQFSPIGCGMSWLTRFVEKCTCLCLPSL